MKGKIITFSLFCFFLISCRVTKNIPGKYKSNFAQSGFFITEIELKSDKSFEYKFTGDLVHTELKGKYTILKNNLYLRFDRTKGETDKDAMVISRKDTVVDFEKLFNSHHYELKKENDIQYHLKYKISNSKLQPYNINTDKLVRKAKKYSHKRKYIIFGPRNYEKKYYLKRIERTIQRSNSTKKLLKPKE